MNSAARLHSAPTSELPHTRPPSVPLYRFLGPRYWAAWLVLGLLRLVIMLPLPAMLAIGRCLGRLHKRSNGTVRAFSAERPCRPSHERR